MQREERKTERRQTSKEQRVTERASAVKKLVPFVLCIKLAEKEYEKIILMMKKKRVSREGFTEEKAQRSFLHAFILKELCSRHTFWMFHIET